jgi:signal transduction histidine kinase
MRQLSIRQWLLLSWLLCLALPRLLFEAAQMLQHTLAPTLTGPTWIVGPLLSALATAGLTLLGVGWLISRWLLVPLAAMERAAHQIAAGNIDVELPPSRVREVNQVAAAFSAMGAGLRAAVGRQATIEQERRVLISAVAHDLRTPLFALRGYLAGIEQGVAATPEKAAHYLAMCWDQATVLDQRINTLFDYARLEYLAQSPRSEPVHWQELIQQTAERLRPSAVQKQIDMRLVGPAPCTLEGDPQLLTRMLENMLENAVRHTPGGGVIEVRWQIEPGRLYFSIADSGPGIETEDLPHVFAPMYRGDPSRSRALGGAGLGLAIAQRIAQAHHGGLSVANRPSGGAEFTGWLARSQPNA